LYLFLCTK